MGMIRDLLLWASGNDTLRDIAPKVPSVPSLLARYMPGETLDDAIAEAHRLASRGLTAAFTALGEDITDAAEGEAVADHYIEVLERIVAEDLDAEISVKPTQLGLNLGEEVAGEHLQRLAETADRLGVWLWIDMESSGYVDATLRLYREIHGRFPRTGVCLQAYLRRTERDLVDLLPVSPSIRIVKGAYREQEPLAFGNRDRIAASFETLALEFLEALAGDETGEQGESGDESRARPRLVLGSHDEALLARIDRRITERGLPREPLEFEMLYGVHPGAERRIVAAGRPLRILIAYGPSWYQWFMRRLAERPANAWLLVKGLVSPDR